jgi:hypothetical protein
MIGNPDSRNVADFVEHNYIYGPLWYINEQPLRKFEDYIASIPISELNMAQRKKKLQDYRRQIQASQKYSLQLEIQDLTDSLFDEWYQLYKRTKLKLANGADVAGSDFTKVSGLTQGNLKGLKFLSLRRPHHELIAAQILYLNDEENDDKALNVIFLALDDSPESKKMNLGYRLYDEVVKWALDQGEFMILRYGMEPNFFSDDLVTPGLHWFKRNLGFNTRFEIGSDTVFSQTRLIKIINPRFLGKQYWHYQFENNDPTKKLILVKEFTQQE